MVKTLVQHVDEAHFRYGGPRRSGEPRQETWRWIGDFQEGPWLSVIEREAGRHVGPHSHDQDEIVFIMEGGVHVGRRRPLLRAWHHPVLPS